MLVSPGFHHSSISRKKTPISDGLGILIDFSEMSAVLVVSELSLFRSEVKMPAHDVEFTTKECRARMKFLFLKGKTAKEIYYDMSVTLREKGPSYSTVKLGCSI
jgi:hypothetical protein